jgi:hypothetical protein
MVTKPLIFANRITLAASPVLIVYHCKQMPKRCTYRYADILALETWIIVIFCELRKKCWRTNVIKEIYCLAFVKAGIGEKSMNILDLRSGVILLQSPQCRICGSY